jgi:hypothetical protein
MPTNIDTELRLDALRVLREGEFTQLYPVWVPEVLHDAVSTDGKLGTTLKRAAETEQLPFYAVGRVEKARKQTTDAIRLARKLEQHFARQADTPKPRGRFS